VFGVNTWLASAGYLTPKSSASPSAIRVTNHAISLAKQLRLNHLVADRVQGRLRRRVSSVTHNTAFVDWSRSRAYGLDFVCPVAGVEINLQGRQAHGIVPSREYEPLRNELIGRLSSIADEDGRHVFERVCRREEIFDGPHVDRFPDVVGILGDDYDVKGHLHLPAIGPNTGQPDYPFMGYHGRDAFFAIRGDGVARGTVGETLGGMIDIAPTLLAASGLDAPAWMEGRAFAW
jgi:predicted AlkP superfamily phosphohydrolase/phosphomutase